MPVCATGRDVSGSMSTIVSDVGHDMGYTFQQDGQTFRAVSGGKTRIDLVNEGLKAYQEDLLTDSLAMQRVEVSVITFGDTVQTVVPFTSASHFTAPTLTAGGLTAMGSAILQAINVIEERKTLYKQNGLHYFRPWIFIITDGEPTDNWKVAAEKIREADRNKNFSFFAVGVEGSNFDILKQISVREPLHLKGYNFREMFVWLSQSQRSVSHSSPGEECTVTLAPPTWANL